MIAAGKLEARVAGDLAPTLCRPASFRDDFRPGRWQSQSVQALSEDSEHPLTCRYAAGLAGWPGYAGHVTTRAVLFDLGNTLVGYYTSAEFPGVLRRCLQECADALGLPEDSARDDDTFNRALSFNCEQPDYAVRPLAERLERLFGAVASPDALVATFLRPIFATARLDPQAAYVLETLRTAGIKTAIVSNTPWGSPANAWREELGRHGLLDKVDATVFCTDVGWRKPHRAPFERALSLLGVNPVEALFVGDDPRWDVLGAQGAGIRPVLLAATSPDGVADHLAIRNLGEIISLVQGTGAATDRLQPTPPGAW
jgi:putative hydrolase of the HAD superfamily